MLKFSVVLLVVSMLGPLGGADSISAELTHADSIHADSIRVEKVADLTETLSQNEIFEPLDVVSDTEGNFYIFDNGDKEIAVFDDAFQYQYSFGREGPGPGEFDRAVSHLLISPDDELIALERWDRTVHFFTLEGDYQDSFFIQKDLDVTGAPQERGFGIPLDIAVDDQSQIHLTDRVWYYSEDQVQVFDRDGTFVESFLPQHSFIPLEEAREAHSGMEEEQTHVGRLLNERQRRIAIDGENNIVIGQRESYVLEKYTPCFEQIWRRELEFDPVKSAHAVRIVRGEEVGYRSHMGEGAVADLAFDDEGHLYVSVGSFDGQLDRERYDELSHWIDVFDRDGNHVARLLENELPPRPLEDGYRIDVQDDRLIVLGEVGLWVYEIMDNT